jgi:hypothetical protein
MTLVGKIFTVLIFVMSCVFMSFAVAVYVTHKNWKQVVDNPSDKVSAQNPLGLTYRLADEQKKRKELQDQNIELEKKWNLERLARNQALAALQTQLIAAQEDLAKQIAAVNDLQQRQREGIVTIETNSNNTARLTAEVEKLRAAIRKAEQERDEQFKKVVALTDEVQQRVGDLARLREREVQLAGQLAQWEKVRVIMNLPPPEQILANPTSNPPPVRGEIVAVSPEGRLVEISIGADDGLKEGHMLEVYRGGTYLGKLVVRRTRPDRAVGEMLPNKLGDVRKGDKVTANKA